MSTPDDAERDAGPGAAPEAPRTGDPRVDEALGRLADLDDADVDDHAERLAAAHGALQEVLRQPEDPRP